jgi:hypothetical protein
VQTDHSSFLADLDKARWLLDINLLLQISVEEGGCHIKMMHLPHFICGDGKK